MRHVRSSLSLAVLALLPLPLLLPPFSSALNLNRPAGTVFVDTGCLKSRRIGARRAFIDKGIGNSCSISPLSSASPSVSSSPTPLSSLSCVPSLTGLSTWSAGSLVAPRSMPPKPGNVNGCAAASRCPCRCVGDGGALLSGGDS